MYALSDAKHVICERFGKSSQTYEGAAEMQLVAAKALAKMLKASEKKIPNGALLELGCGTGLFSRFLCHLFPHRALWITDLSDRLTEACRQNLIAQNVLYKNKIFQLDGEKLDTTPPVALITSNMVLQWFSDPYITLENWINNHLVRKGVIAISFLGAESFPEWRKSAEKANVPYTANPLPSLPHIKKKLDSLNVAWEIEELWLTTSHIFPIDFFVTLKATGATANLQNLRLTTSQFRQLCWSWPLSKENRANVSYQIVCLLATAG